MDHEPEARLVGHRAARRARRDPRRAPARCAIDDPQLTTRIPGGRDALPVILDSHLQLATGSARCSKARGVRSCTLVPGSAISPADIVQVPPGPGGVDLRAVLADLVERGVHSVLVEGGGLVIRSFLDAGLVDRIELFVSPKVLAGGPGWVGGEGFHLEDAPTFVVTDVGEDRTGRPSLVWSAADVQRNRSRRRDHRRCDARGQRAPPLRCAAACRASGAMRSRSATRSAVNGACLTVDALAPDGFEVVLGKETIDRTTLGALALGARVNLERSLRLSAIASTAISCPGHVDGVGSIRSATRDAESIVIWIDAPRRALLATSRRRDRSRSTA